MNTLIEYKKITSDIVDDYYVVLNKNRSYLSKYLNWIDSLSSFKDEKIYLQSRNQIIDDTFAIYYDNKIVGGIDINNLNQEKNEAEIVYWLDYDYQGKGIMNTVMLGMLNYTFNVLKLNSLFAVCAIDNVKGVKVLDKSGFVIIGKEKEKLKFKNGRKLDCYIYSLTYEQYKKYSKDMIEQLKNQLLKKEQKKQNENNINLEEIESHVNEFMDIENITNQNKDEVKEVETRNKDLMNNKNEFSLDDIKDIDLNQFNKEDIEKINKIQEEVKENSERTKDGESYVLLEGTIEFAGKLISFKISKINGQIYITASIIRSGEVLAEKVDEFLEVDENKWELNTEKTDSNIPLTFENTDNEISFSSNSMKLFLNKENGELYFDSATKVNLTEYSQFKKEQDHYNLDINCDQLLNKNVIYKAVLNPIAKNMVESYEKKIYEGSKQNAISESMKNKIKTQEKDNVKTQ